MLRISYCASDSDAIGSSIYCGAGCHFAVLGNLRSAAGRISGKQTLNPKP